MIISEKHDVRVKSKKLGARYFIGKEFICNPFTIQFGKSMSGADSDLG